LMSFVVVVVIVNINERFRNCSRKKMRERDLLIYN
jgi:hypothetical protein